MMRHRDVFHRWAHQTPNRKGELSAKYGNVYFDGPTIYSYGSHFPMATIVTRKGRTAHLVTTRTYSVTTAGHINATREAIPHGATVFNVPLTSQDVSRLHLSEAYKEVLSDFIDDYQRRITVAMSDFGNTRRKAYNRLADLTTANSLAAECNALMDFFGVRRRRIDVQPVDNDTLADLRQKAEAQREALAARRESRWGKLEGVSTPKERAEKLRRWLSGEIITPPYSYGGTNYLRISPDNPEEVETDRYAIVPLSHVRRMLPRLLAIEGGPYPDAAKLSASPMRIGEYSIAGISADKVTVGCHHFTWAELNRFNAVLAGTEVNALGLGVKSDE